MKQLIFLAFLFATYSLSGQSANVSPVVASQANAGVLTVDMVETRPFFPGCELLSDLSERGKCADLNMTKFLFAEMKYPAEARKKKIKGTVIVTFNIREDGTVTDASVLEDIGGGCGAEALRAVKLMPKWQPGMQGGKPVTVKYTLPLKFNLQ